MTDERTRAAVAALALLVLLAVVLVRGQVPDVVSNAVLTVLGGWLGATVPTRRGTGE